MSDERHIKVSKPGYPMNVRKEWHGLGDLLSKTHSTTIDAAGVWLHDGREKGYFFCGRYYSRYTLDGSVDRADPGYPKLIEGNWEGIPMSDEPAPAPVPNPH